MTFHWTSRMCEREAGVPVSTNVNAKLVVAVPGWNCAGPGGMDTVPPTEVSTTRTWTSAPESTRLTGAVMPNTDSTETSRPGMFTNPVDVVEAETVRYANAWQFMCDPPVASGACG